MSMCMSACVYMCTHAYCHTHIYTYVPPCPLHDLVQWASRHVCIYMCMTACMRACRRRLAGRSLRVGVSLTTRHKLLYIKPRRSARTHAIYHFHVDHDGYAACPPTLRIHFRYLYYLSFSLSFSFSIFIFLYEIIS